MKKIVNNASNAFLRLIFVNILGFLIRLHCRLRNDNLVIKLLEICTKITYEYLDLSFACQFLSNKV